MKRKINLLFFLFVNVLLVMAQDDEDEHAKLVFKGYPANFLLSKMPHYFGEERIGFEVRLAKHQTLEIGASAITPNPISLFYGLLSSGGDRGSDWYMFFGGRGMLTYRYYFQDEDISFKGPYIGPEISVLGIVSNKRFEYSVFARSRSKAIMVNANVTAGYQFLFSRTSRRNRERLVALNLGLSVGYRYYYFWRHYDNGNIEYSRKEIYGWYKKVPVGAWINFSLGGVF